MSFPQQAFINKAQEQNHTREYIDNVLTYVNKLESRNFPVIFSLEHFAIELGVQSSYIKRLIELRNYQYDFFLLNKKNPKSAPREIMAPKEELKYIQRWINYNILQKAQFNPYMQGFIPATSILKNAKEHENANFLLKIDLLKFFDCVDDKRVYKIFRGFGYSKNISWDFTKICTFQHRDTYWESIDKEDKITLKSYIDTNPYLLPQGAPTSPLLANLAAQKIDIRIGKLSEKMKFKYTRYADDLCISAQDKNSIPSVHLLRKIIEEEGFFINPNKIKFSRKGIKQYVTGLSISNGISIQKAKRREIFKHLYFANKYGIESHIQKLIAAKKYKPNFQNWLLGHISFHYSINKKVGLKMFMLYNKINWDIDMAK